MQVIAPVVRPVKKIFDFVRVVVFLFMVPLRHVAVCRIKYLPVVILLLSLTEESTR